LLYLKHVQNSLQTVRRLRLGTAWAVVEQQINPNALRLEAVLSNPMTRYRYVLSGVLMPNYIKAGRTCIRNETQRWLTITAIALERCRLRDGRFPTELDALVPQLLCILPIDPMSPKPLRYRHNGDGNFTLYSVGDDGRDGGGDPHAGSGTSKFGQWEGKDPSGRRRRNNVDRERTGPSHAKPERRVSRIWLCSLCRWRHR
jgi:hypothetical protein